MSNYNSLPLAKQKFHSIDVMRGIAILMVILVHTSQRIEGEMHLRFLSDYGQMGVQMFFIASAFTLSYSVESRSSNKEPLRNFYISRFFRIAPGYYFGIALYFIVTSLFTGVWTSSKNPVDILANVLFLNGIYQPGNNNVVPGGWSIGTEMLFYLIFPLLFSFYIKLQKKYNNTYLFFPVVMLFFSLAIQLAFYILTKNPSYFNNNGFIYYSILNQLPVFCIGISLYIAFKKGVTQNIKTSTAMIFFTLFSVLSGIIMFYGSTFFVFSSAIFPFISALSFAFLFVLLQNFNSSKGKLFAKIGVLSYSSYLIHFIFTFYFVSTLATIFNSLQSDVLLVISFIATVILTYFSANLMYIFIETKGTKVGKIIISHLDKKAKIKEFVYLSEKEAN